MQEQQIPRGYLSASHTTARDRLTIRINHPRKGLWPHTSRHNPKGEELHTNTSICSSPSLRPPPAFYRGILSLEMPAGSRTHAASLDLCTKMPGWLGEKDLDLGVCCSSGHNAWEAPRLQLQSIQPLQGTDLNCWGLAISEKWQVTGARCLLFHPCVTQHTLTTPWRGICEHRRQETFPRLLLLLLSAGHCPSVPCGTQPSVSH